MHGDELSRTAACRSPSSSEYLEKTASFCLFARLLASLGALAGCSDAAPGRPDLGSESAPDDGPDTPGSTQGKPHGMAGVDGGQSGSGASGINLSGQPKYFRVVRLTNAQWAQSVQDLLALPASPGLEADFQKPVSGTTDFSNNELLLDVNQRGWSDYQAAAEKLVDQVTSSSSALAAIYPKTDSAGFIATLGRRVYRRPLTQSELSAYSELYTQGSTMSGSKSAFAKGAALVLRALLQSPHFLYRTELSPAGEPLSGYEIAAKLSLWLRGTTPDEALLATAAKLTNPDAVATQAEAMLEEPAAVAVMREFERERLHFERYSQISKVAVPDYTDALNIELEDTSYLFFDTLFQQGLGVRDMFTSTKGFVGPEMAKLYDVAPSKDGYVERELGAARAGYFTQLPFLTLFSLNDEPDSIHRGVSLNLDVLCAPLGPPAAVLPPIPPLQPGQTNRQRIDTLTSGCGGTCHNAMINPLGFAFEHFDGLGQYRERENGGLSIDSSGSYLFGDGEKGFDDAAGLMHLLAEEPQTHLCYAKKIASFGLQRDIAEDDLPFLQQLASTSIARGGSVKRVIVELVKSDAFRKHAPGAP